MIRKIATFILLFAALGYSQAQAQYIIGASYENRSQEPTNGFGLHFQNDFSLIPLVNLGIRFQASFYNESYNARFQDIEVRRDDTSYDFGLSTVATVNVGLIAPYAGVGIGYEVLDRDQRAVSDPGGNISTFNDTDNSFFYYGMIGAGITAIPIVRPFVEYRYRGVTSTDFMPSKYGTWAFGLQLRF